MLVPFSFLANIGVINALQRRLSTEGFVQVTLLRNVWSVYKICKSDKNFSSFSFSLYYTSFYWLLTEAYLEPGRISTIELFLLKYLTALDCQLFRKKKLHCRCLSGLKISFWFEILSLLLFPVLKSSRGNTQPENV